MDAKEHDFQLRFLRVGDYILGATFSLLLAQPAGWSWPDWIMDIVCSFLASFVLAPAPQDSKPPTIWDYHGGDFPCIDKHGMEPGAHGWLDSSIAR